jgi:predicted permease
MGPGERGPRRRTLRVRADAPGVEADLDEEVRFHLEKKVEALMAEGWSREDAEAEAHRRFGDVNEVKRGMRRMTRKKERKMMVGGWREAVFQDIRYALRTLREKPLFAVVVSLTLALGIGVNTAIFSVVDGILFRPLPFPEPDELVVLWTDVTARGGPDDEWFSYANFRDVRDEAASLEAAAAWGGWSPTWTDTQEPQQLRAAVVTEGMLSEVLRVDPVAGRTLLPEDHLPGAPGRLLISNGFWERAFGRDPSALGSTLTLMDEPYEIVGVMPAGFLPPFVPTAELWVPEPPPENADQARGGFSWRVVARLADGVSVERASNEVGELGARFQQAYPQSNTGMTFRAVALQNDMVADTRAGLLVLLGAVGLVLLVACVNVANLLLARASGRTQELAVRSALGAGRTRIFGQVLTESLVLAGIGGVLGIALAFVGTDLLVALAPEGTPRIDEVAVNGRVLAFTGGVTVLSGLLFGLVPALRVARTDLHVDLRDGGRSGMSGSGGRLRSGLVVAQVALAMVLLVGAGLLVRSFQNLRTTDLGFDPEGVVTMQVSLPASRYPDAETIRTFTDALDERLQAIPGVEAAGLASTIPLIGFDGDVGIRVEGRPEPEPGEEDAAWFRRVTPGYLDAMRMSIVQGRWFTAQDGPDDGLVVVINETAAANLFPGENPVGQRVMYNFDSDANPIWRDVIGIARDIRNFGIRDSGRNAMYVPSTQSAGRTYFPVLRTSGDPGAAVAAVREELRALDGSLALARVETMDDIVRSAVAPDRFVAFLLGLFATVSLLLAVVGLYGVVSYEVSTRVRELGVRMALGAAGGQLSRGVVGRSLVLVGAGVGIGLAVALLLGSVVESLLYGVGLFDPSTLVSVVLVLAGAAGVAAAVPAMRASRVDPSVVLRGD